MMARRRVGLLGGTFDPVHEGHLQMAALALLTLELDEVRFLPAGQPYHKGKPTGADAGHRLAMVRLAVAGHARYVVDDSDLRRPGATYTVDTLLALRAHEELRPAALVWLLGADAFAGMPSWHRHDVLLSLAHFAVFPRIGFPPIAAPTMVPPDAPWAQAAAGCVIAMPTSPPSVSSTAIRDVLSAPNSGCDLLPTAVYEYIRLHGLYRSDQTKE
jgi:nicotinate-nucleotide adenylyltransferase